MNKVPEVQLNLTYIEIMRMTGAEMRRLLYKSDGTPKPGYREALGKIVNEHRQQLLQKSLETEVNE